MFLNSKLKRFIGRIINNAAGWKTNRRIIVFESDDWGSIRMPSIECYNELLQSGYPVDKNYFEQLDGLETEQDLNALLDLFKDIKNKHGKIIKFTQNFILTNPDFEKMKSHDYMEYFYEDFPETYKKYNSENAMKIIHDGIADGFFVPQFHGNSHFNIVKWMHKLHDKNSDVYKVLKYNIVGITSSENPKLGNELLNALNLGSMDELAFQTMEITNGLTKFKQIFGFHSESFIPPVYIYHPQLNGVLKNNGVKFLQGGKYQLVPKGDWKLGRIKRVLGTKTIEGQINLIRNCFFEPSSYATISKGYLNRILQDIKVAFLMNKPAIISTHRINFTSRLNPENREKNIVLFKELLENVIQKWPDVEFLSTPELGNLIEISK